MIALLGAFCIMIIFAGGAVSCHDFWLGVGTMAPGALGLGLLFAIVSTTQHRTGSFDTREGLTVRHLKKFLTDVPWVSDDTKVYVRDHNALEPATHVFSCLLDGGKSMVIERIVEKPQPHDLF